MRFRSAAALLFGACTLCLVVACADRTPDTPAPAGAPAVDPDAPSHEVQLYFPGRDGRLHAEPRILGVAASSEASIAGLVEALLAGPRGEDLWPPLAAALEPTAPAVAEDTAEAETVAPAAADAVPDEGVRVGMVHLLDDGTAVLDLLAKTPPAIGTREERLSLYSLVNTVVLNTPEANRMILLWNGSQPLTFAGHIDTAHPLVADRGLIARPPP